MDIISHGLYGGVIFGRKSKISYWKAFFFGIMPDLLSFGIFFVLFILNFISGPDFDFHHPESMSVPAYVYTLYNITHSFVIAFIMIGILWLLQGRLMIELFAWPLHVLVDIPTHSSEFFPTPFLWPISSYYFNGMSWGSLYIFLPNIILLSVLYVQFYFRKKKMKN